MKKILGGNLLRVMGAVQAEARKRNKILLEGNDSSSLGVRAIRN